MVRLRLRRVGARNQPSYRIVAADKRSPRNGRFLEIVGHYNPRTEPATINVDEARVYHWLDNGAQPSDAVETILKTSGTWDRWERHKQGEEIDKLVQEAIDKAVEVDPRTRRDDLRPTGTSKTAEEAEASASEEPSEDSKSEAEEVAEDAGEAETDKNEADEVTVEEAAEEESEEADAEAAEGDQPGEEATENEKDKEEQEEEKSS